jgi:hypothetical protein
MAITQRLAFIGSRYFPSPFEFSCDLDSSPMRGGQFECHKEGARPPLVGSNAAPAQKSVDLKQRY